MVLVHCIARSQRLKIDFRDDNFKKIFWPKTIMPRALIFGMKHQLVDLYQVCSNYTPGAKNGPAPRGHMFNIGFNGENIKTLLV